MRRSLLVATALLGSIPSLALAQGGFRWPDNELRKRYYGGFAYNFARGPLTGHNMKPMIQQQVDRMLKP